MKTYVFKWPLDQGYIITLGIQSYSQMMSKGCPITETKRIVFRFHETILRFGEPGSLGLKKHVAFCLTDFRIPFSKSLSITHSNLGFCSSPSPVVFSPRPVQIVISLHGRAKLSRQNDYFFSDLNLNLWGILDSSLSLLGP